MQREPGLLQDPRLTRMLGKWGVYDQDTLVSMFKSAGVGPAQYSQGANLCISWLESGCRRSDVGRVFWSKQAGRHLSRAAIWLLLLLLAHPRPRPRTASGRSRFLWAVDLPDARP